MVDEYLAPVPLGAPGEIVFSGVCVGRGYINDPVRTRAAFLTDPIRVCGGIAVVIMVVGGRTGSGVFGSSGFAS